MRACPEWESEEGNTSNPANEPWRSRVLHLQDAARGKNPDWTVSLEPTPQLWSRADPASTVKGLDAVRDYLEPEA